MATCKKVLLDPLEGAVILKCDLDEFSAHRSHHDKIYDVYWRRPFDDVLSKVKKPSNERQMYAHVSSPADLPVSSMLG